MFTWIRRCCRCKVILPVLAAASITLFSIVPFSASAYEHDPDAYLLRTTNLFEAFPYDIDTDLVEQKYNQVVLYNGNNFHHNSTDYATYNLYHNNVAEGGTAFPWNAYYRFTDFYCKSAFADFCIVPLDFKSSHEYLFQFTLKTSFRNGIISSGMYLNQVNLEFASDDTVLSFHPTSMFSDSSYIYVQFSFIVPGRYLDSYPERVIKFYYASTNEETLRDGDFVLALHSDYEFLITDTSSDMFREAQAYADAIANIGSNVPPVDFSDSGNAVTSLTDTAAAIDEQYALDPGETSEAMNSAASLFTQSGFVNASNVIKTWINQFLDSNVAIYSMLVCCLGLGLAFFAIGRSSSG